MSGFIVGGGKSDFRENWRSQIRLFPIKQDPLEDSELGSSSR